jgi:formiminotetrahydrofolate cyclodeaminase
MKDMRFPVGWDEERVRRVLSHYEKQTDEEAAAEDEVAFKSKGRAAIEVPVELIPVIREIIAQYKATARA